VTKIVTVNELSGHGNIEQNLTKVQLRHQNKGVLAFSRITEVTGQLGTEYAILITSL
jgi:hypothetical protein